MKAREKIKKIFDYILFKLNLSWINLAVCFAVIFMYVYSVFAGEKVPYRAVAVSIVAGLVLVVLNLAIFLIRKNKFAEIAKNIVPAGSPAGIVGGLQLPAFVCSFSGECLWCNSKFRSMADLAGVSSDKAQKQIFEQYIKEKFHSGITPFEVKIKFGGKDYKLCFSAVKPESNSAEDIMLVAHFEDISVTKKLSDLFRNKQICVGEIAIDNYEELMQASGETVVNRMLVEATEVFKSWLEGKNAIIKRLVRERYIFIVEAGYLKEIEEEKFSILGKIKEINKGNTMPMTLSIGVSTNLDNLSDDIFEKFVQEGLVNKDVETAFNNNLVTNFERAEKLIKLCMGRGGDQAIVQNGDDPKKSLFFGGEEVQLPRDNKVPMRVNATILKESIDKADRVYVMGHRMGDMDALGAAMAIRRIALELGKNSFVVLDSSNSQIKVMYDEFVKNTAYAGAFISQEEALNTFTESSLVVLCDTFSIAQSEAPKLLENAKNRIVIDHHRSGVELVNPVIAAYIEPNASSTSELVIEITQHLFNRNIFTKEEAECLYGGIIIDTKNLYFKTDKRTFEAVGYLKSIGVNPLNIKKFVQPSSNDFVKISEIATGIKVKSVFMGNGLKHVAYVHCKLSKDEANVLASMVADKMVEIAGVDCSFIFIQQEGGIAIKARSLGDVNVQAVLEHGRIGGGGHLTAAGGFMKDATPAEAENLIFSIMGS